MHDKRLKRTFSRLTKSTLGLYSIVGLISRAAPFAVSIFLASVMQPSDYGKVALVITVAAVFSSLSNFGFGVLVARESHVIGKDEFSALIASNRFLAMMILLLALMVIALVEIEIYISSLSVEWLVLSVSLGFLLGRVEIVSKFLVAQEKAKEFALLDVLSSLIPAVASLVLVGIFIDFALTARVSGVLFGAILSVVFASALLGRHIDRHPPSIHLVWRNFLSGTQVLPQMFAIWIKLGADKVVIGTLIGIELLGAYAFTFTLCSLFMVIGNAWIDAFIGPCMTSYKQGDWSGVSDLRKKYLFFATAFAALTAGFIIGLPYLYWPEGYTISKLSIVLIMFALWAQVVYFLFAKYFLFRQKMLELGNVNLISAFLYLGLLSFSPWREVEFVALCYCLFSVSQALYVAFRVTVLEARELGTP